MHKITHGNIDKERMKKRFAKTGFAAWICLLLLSLALSGCRAAPEPSAAPAGEETAAPEGETAPEEAAEVVDQDTAAASRYAGVYRAKRDMRKALNLTLPEGAGQVSTKVILNYILTLNADETFLLKTADEDAAFQEAKKKATIEIVRSVQTQKLKEAGYSEDQFDEVAQISEFEDFEDMVLKTAEKQMENSAQAVSYFLEGSFRTQDRFLFLEGKNADGKEETLTLRIRRDGNFSLFLDEQKLRFIRMDEDQQ